MAYFNYSLAADKGAWDRRVFLRRMFLLGRSDSRWVPEHAPTLSWALNPAQNAHLARLNCQPVRLEALQRMPHSGANRLPSQSPSLSTVIEQPVTTAVLQFDSRCGRTALLSLLNCINDSETWHTFLELISEMLFDKQYFRLIGPLGLSPHIGSGLLLDNWHLPPPLHTAYNPPFLVEMIGDKAQPLLTQRLYHLPITQTAVPTPPANLTIQPLDVAQLAHALLPLWQAACANPLGLPLPDAVETRFMLRWLGVSPLHGWLALHNGRPVGFVLLQPDTAAQLRLARGARLPWWWLWYGWRQNRPVANGRLLFGAVLPEWRRQGIGRLLLQQVQHDAHQRGWGSVTVGPLADEATAVHLLRRADAVPQQTYGIFELPL